MKNLTDIDLLAALIQDDEVAFTQIYNRYQPLLYVVCYKYLKDEDTANDVVQSVFIWLWENRSTLSIDLNLKNYLCTSTKNKILNLLRHENVTIQHNYAYAQLRLSEDTWLEKMQQEGLLQRVRELIDQLPPQRQQICCMRIDQHMNNQQIADAMGLSVQTVRNQYSAAIKTLREQLKEKNQFFLRLG